MKQANRIMIIVVSIAILLVGRYLYHKTLSYQQMAQERERIETITSFRKNDLSW